ncbi:MAG: plastocyanin/azurin family copper-binding protein [Chloroflexota bacterium]
MTFHRTHVLAALVGLPLALALAGCGATAGPASAAPEVTVRATEFAFGLNPIRIPVGTPVRLVLVNAGVVEHDLVVRELPAKNVRATAGGHGHGSEVAAHAAPGARAWVEFTPTQAGAYTVECTVPGHKEAGMQTTLIVE